MGKVVFTDLITNRLLGIRWCDIGKYIVHLQLTKIEDFGDHGQDELFLDQPSQKSEADTEMDNVGDLNPAIYGLEMVLMVP